MYGRKNRGKRGFRRAVVTLLTFVMLVSTCFPSLVANAAEESEIAVAAAESQEITAGAATQESAAAMALQKTETQPQGTEGETEPTQTQPQGAEGETKPTESQPQGTEGETKPTESQSQTTEEETEPNGTGSGSQAPEGETEPQETVPQETEDENTEVQQDPAVTELYNRLMSASTYEELSDMMEAMSEGEYDLLEQFTEDQSAALKERIAELSGTKPKKLAGWPGGGGGQSATSGTFDHLEVEITGKVTIKIGNQTFSPDVTLSTTDVYNVNAYTLDESGNKVAYKGYTFESVKVGDGSTADDTVELHGTYQSGTKENPIHYVISVVKTVTVTLSDGTSLDIPVTLTIDTWYWDSRNNCPGIRNTSSWQNGNFINGSGIDVPLTGEYVGTAITKGKLAIQKTIVNEAGNTVTDTTSFNFYIQNNSGAYLTFDGYAYTGTSATLAESCYVTVSGGTSVVLTEIPEGLYTITEGQKGGYIVANADGSDGSGYSKDYVVEEKTDDEIPIAGFYNKKLTNAGISLKKVASGIADGTYPNPTVSIYAVGEDGNKKGNAVWFGQLTANGDTLYLTTTLPAGTYIIEETGHTADGYDCQTTISGGAAVDGMKFTVLAGARYDLTVTNVYTAKPQTTSITVKKTVSGNMADLNKAFEFTATFSGDYSFTAVTYTKTDKDGKVSTGTITDNSCTFTLAHDEQIVFGEVPIGATLLVTEVANNYVVTTTSKSTDADADANDVQITVPENGDTITFNNKKEAPIDTGLDLTTFPFILLFSTVTVLSTVLLIGKRRYGEF